MYRQHVGSRAHLVPEGANVLKNLASSNSSFVMVRSNVEVSGVGHEPNREAPRCPRRPLDRNVRAHAFTNTSHVTTPELNNITAKRS